MAPWRLFALVTLAWPVIAWSGGRPESYGAIGDGRADDTAALREWINAGMQGPISLSDGARYLVSGVLRISTKTTITGKGVIVASPLLESALGPGSDLGVLTIERGAEDSSVSGLSIDLNGVGRTGLHISADRVYVRDVTVSNYVKSSKANGNNYSTSDSGFRVHGSGVRLSSVHCRDMRTEVADSVPRCITVEGGANEVTLDGISGTRLNGGITLGWCDDVRISDWRFSDLRDNGLYVLGRATGVVAVNGELTNTEEPAVFKSSGSQVRGLKIVNQRLPIGVEEARDLLIESVSIDFTEDFDGRPAFVRARKANDRSAGIVVRQVRARMLLGDSVFNMGAGAVDGVVVENAVFELVVKEKSRRRQFVWRQSRGQPPTFRNVLMNVIGPIQHLPQQVYMSLPGSAYPSPTADAPGLDVRIGGRTVRVRIQ